MTKSKLQVKLCFHEKKKSKKYVSIKYRARERMICPCTSLLASGLSLNRFFFFFVLRSITTHIAHDDEEICNVSNIKKYKNQACLWMFAGSSIFSHRFRQTNRTCSMVVCREAEHILRLTIDVGLVVVVHQKKPFRWLPPIYLSLWMRN